MSSRERPTLQARFVRNQIVCGDLSVLFHSLGETHESNSASALTFGTFFRKIDVTVTFTDLSGAVTSFRMPDFAFIYRPKDLAWDRFHIATGVQDELYRLMGRAKTPGVAWDFIKWKLVETVAVAAGFRSEFQQFILDCKLPLEWFYRK